MRQQEKVKKNDPDIIFRDALLFPIYFSVCALFILMPLHLVLRSFDHKKIGKVLHEKVK